MPVNKGRASSKDPDLIGHSKRFLAAQSRGSFVYRGNVNFSSAAQYPLRALLGHRPLVRLSASEQTLL